MKIISTFATNMHILEKIMKKIIFVWVAWVLLMSSCTTSKDITYLQNVDELSSTTLSQTAGIPDQVVMPGDLLDITVMATDRAAVQPFNRRVVDYTRAVGTALNSDELNFYLVDNNGYIDMPVLGRIYVQGMTKSQLEDYVRGQIHPKYIHEVPAVTVRFENFRISVLGDVKSPDTYVIPNERVNILEAIALAGDLNITGRRDNVLLVRTNADGTRTTVRLDLKDKDLIISPYFYLQQNDVIYVEPNNSKASTATVVPPTASLAISVTGAAISAASLIMTILNYSK